MVTMENLGELYAYFAKLSREEAYSLNGNLEIVSNLSNLSHKAPCVSTDDILALITHLRSAINITMDRKLMYELEYNIFGCTDVSNTYELRISILTDNGCLFDTTLYLLEESIQYLISRYDKSQICLEPKIPGTRYKNNAPHFHDTSDFISLEELTYNLELKLKTFIKEHARYISTDTVNPFNLAYYERNGMTLKDFKAKYYPIWIEGIKDKDITSDDMVEVGVVDADKHTIKFESLPVILPFDDMPLYKKPKTRFTRTKRKHKKGRRK